MRLQIKTIAIVLLVMCLSHGIGLFSQVIDEEEQVRQKQSSMPKAINFYQLLDENKITREEFEIWKKQQELKLERRMTQAEALEGAVDPDAYKVGPDDVFYFNIWGSMENRFPLTVSPEGTLYIPSAGEIEVDGLTLNEVKSRADSAAADFYSNSSTSLTLVALRFFRVHVVGEVEFPGTFVARAVDRVSEMIKEAGGVTKRAWKGRIEIRHSDNTKHHFDLAQFERDGKLADDIFVNGGDVIFVPGVGFGNGLIQVEADQEFSGAYRLVENENLLEFLQRIRALKRNTDLSQLVVIRHEDGRTKYHRPFDTGRGSVDVFILQPGDRIVLPSQYVYVKGAVRQPGAYPYVFNLTAKEYAGMAGGDYRSASIRRVSVYHANTGKTEKGPDVLVEPGDIVHLDLAWHQRFGNYLRIVSTFVSLLLAAKAAGFFGE